MGKGLVDLMGDISEAARWIPKPVRHNLPGGVGTFFRVIDDSPSVRKRDALAAAEAADRRPAGNGGGAPSRVAGAPARPPAQEPATPARPAAQGPAPAPASHGQQKQTFDWAIGKEDLEYLKNIVVAEPAGVASSAIDTLGTIGNLRTGILDLGRKAGFEDQINRFVLATAGTQIPYLGVAMRAPSSQDLKNLAKPVPVLNEFTEFAPKSPLAAERFTQGKLKADVATVFIPGVGQEAAVTKVAAGVLPKAVSYVAKQLPEAAVGAATGYAQNVAEQQAARNPNVNEGALEASIKGAAESVIGKMSADALFRGARGQNLPSLPRKPAEPPPPAAAPAAVPPAPRAPQPGPYDHDALKRYHESLESIARAEAAGRRDFVEMGETARDGAVADLSSSEWGQLQLELARRPKTIAPPTPEPVQVAPVISPPAAPAPPPLTRQQRYWQEDAPRAVVGEVIGQGVEAIADLYQAPSSGHAALPAAAQTPLPPQAPPRLQAESLPPPPAERVRQVSPFAPPRLFPIGPAEPRPRPQIDEVAEPAPPPLLVMEAPTSAYGPEVMQQPEETHQLHDEIYGYTGAPYFLPQEPLGNDRLKPRGLLYRP